MVDYAKLIPQRREDWASFCIVCITLFIGVPLWWLTTTTKRSTLPLERIDAFTDINENTYYENDEEKMTLIPISPNVEVMFILAIAQPKNMHATWLSEAAIQEVLDPLVEFLSPVMNITIVTKTLFYIDAKSTVDLKTGQRKLTSLGISSLVTNVESVLGSALSPNPVIHAVLYIPDDDGCNNPLLITGLKKSSSTPPLSDAVVLPRWGMIKIANDLACVGDSAEHIKSTVPDTLLNDFLPEIFSLIGLPITQNKQERSICGLWSESDYIRALKKITLRYLGSAISSLKSLGSLLQKIKSIVINEHVAANVRRSVEQVEKAQQQLLLLNDTNNTDRQKMLDAVAASASAFSFAESAFFDPSLLELLYFPDDQKFAVYIPLFLPIGLPILLSILSALKNRIRPKKNDTAVGSEKSVVVPAGFDAASTTTPSPAAAAAAASPFSDDEDKFGEDIDTVSSLGANDAQRPKQE